MFGVSNCICYPGLIVQLIYTDTGDLNVIKAINAHDGLGSQIWFGFEIISFANRIYLVSLPRDCLVVH